MRGKEVLLVILCVGLCPRGAAAADDQQGLVIRAGTIWTATGETLTKGQIVIEQGKILAVGAYGAVPERAKILEMPDKYVMPGLVDPHCHLGLSLDVLGEIEERVSAVTPEMRVLDAYNPLGQDVTRALGSGVTTVLLSPGYRNPIAGQMAIVKLVGRRDDAGLVTPVAGIEFSLGSEALMSDRRPTSRAGLMALIREELDKAVKVEPNNTDPRTEVLNRVVTRRLPVHLYCNTVDEILAALQLVDRYKLDASLVGAREADEVAQMIAERNIPTVYGPVLLLSKDKDLKRAVALAGAGVRVAFASFAPKTDLSDLRTSAILAARYGMARETALRAVTLTAAEILGVASRLGSLEPGKDADLLILSGDPLELTSRIEMVMVGGTIVYRREEK